MIVSTAPVRAPRRAAGPPWAVPTATGWWLLALALTLLVAGHVLAPRLAGVGLLTDAGLLLGSVLAVSAAVAWGAAALCRPQCRLTGPDRAWAGRGATWTLAVTTRLPAGTPMVVTWEARGSRDVSDAAAVVTAPCGNRVPVLDGAAELRLDLGERGGLELAARRLTLTDPLGLVRGHRPLTVSAAALVLPRPLRLSVNVLGGLAAREAVEGESAAGHARGAGQNGDLRPYRPGDSLGSVHWRQSARLGSLLVTERETEELTSTVVVLDADPASYRPGGPGRDEPPSRPWPAVREPEQPGAGAARRSDRERAVRLAAAVLAELDARGAQVALETIGGDGDVSQSVPGTGTGDGALSPAALSDDARRAHGAEDGFRVLALLPRAAGASGPSAGTRPAADDEHHGTDPAPRADVLITGPRRLTARSGVIDAGVVLVVEDDAVRVLEGTPQ